MIKALSQHWCQYFPKWTTFYKFSLLRQYNISEGCSLKGVLLVPWNGFPYKHNSLFIYIYILQWCHVCMGAMASQINSVSIVCSAVCSSADQRKHQNYASLAFVMGIHTLQRASNMENVSIWRRHHDLWYDFTVTGNENPNKFVQAINSNRAHILCCIKW